MRFNESVLFFPSIEINNEAWLKSSLLLWDHIYRIVPTTYSPNDLDCVRLCIDQDIIRPVCLESRDLNHVTDKYLKFLNSLEFLPSGLDDHEYDRLHYEKIDHRLYELLQNESIRFDSEGFYHLGSRFVQGYMFFLSKTISERRNLMMATDNRDAWTVMPYFSEKGNFSEQVWNPQAEGFYTSLIFTDILPRNIEQINIHEIIKFVNKRRDERNKLREVLSSFIQGIAKCSSYDHIAQLRSDFKKEISLAKRDFRKSSGLFNNDFCFSAVNVGVPVGLSLFAAINPQNNDPYQLSRILPSIFIGAIASYLNFRKAKMRWKFDSPYSFLIDIDDHLMSKRRIWNYSRSFNEFIND